MLTLTLTSCMTVLKTKEALEDVKVEEKEEVKDEAPIQEPDEKGEEEPEETAEEENDAPITPSENETEAVIADFGEVSEEALDAIIEGLTGGETLEFPPVPLN